MLSDIEIAQKAKLKPIAEIAAGLGITDPDLILPNGNYKAKLSVRLLEQLKDRAAGKLVLVTAVTSTSLPTGRSFNWSSSLTENFAL